MKVAVFSESAADEAAVRTLLDGLCGQETERPQMPPIRSRGWSAVLRNLPAVLRHLHYQTDAEALVVVLDSDHSPLHEQTHDEPGGSHEKCRLCRMADLVANVRSRLPSDRLYGPVKVALGLAVPQIEAWYLVGRDPHVSEAAWRIGLESGKYPYTPSSLKEKVYGTDDPPLALEIQCATREAERIVRVGKLSSLQQRFPGGFGPLAAAVRTW